MKKKYILPSLVLTFCIIFPQPNYAKDTKIVGKINALSGTVEVKKGGKKTFDAFENMSFTQGDTIFTGSKSKAVLHVDSTKEVTMSANTKLVIKQLVSSLEAQSGKTSFDLSGGKVKVKINEKLKGESKFQVQTPNAIMGVMGTEFAVAYDGDKTYVAVYEGWVRVDAPQQQPVDIYPNQFLQLNSDGSIEIRELGPAEQAFFDLESNLSSPPTVATNWLLGQSEIRYNPFLESDFDEDDSSGGGSGDGDTPTDPGDSGGGDTPTDPGDSGGGDIPTDPGDSGGGDTPTDPGDSGGGDTPTDPGDSGGGDIPTDPGDSGGGDIPTDPGDSGGGDTPTDPGDSGGGDIPTDPGDSGGGDTPTDPGDSGGGDTPTDPGDSGGGDIPTDPGDSGGGDIPTDPGDSGGGDIPTDPGDSGGGDTPTDPGDSGGGDIPTDPGDSGGGDTPTDPQASDYEQGTEAGKKAALDELLADYFRYGWQDAFQYDFLPTDEHRQKFDEGTEQAYQIDYSAADYSEAIALGRNQGIYEAYTNEGLTPPLSDYDRGYIEGYNEIANSRNPVPQEDLDAEQARGYVAGEEELQNATLDSSYEAGYNTIAKQMYNEHALGKKSEAYEQAYNAALQDIQNATGP